MSQLTLYSFRRCPFAMRVRFVLNEKNVPFTIKEEDLKNFSPELRALHPEAKVPLLVHDDLVLYESAIIVEYLEEAFPTPALMPATPKARAEVRRWTYWCNQLFKRDVDRVKYGTSRFSEAECEGAAERLQGHLAFLDKALAASGWLVGDKFSLADCNVFPFYRQFLGVKPMPIDLAPYARLKAWGEKVSGRESFKKTLEA